MTIVEALAKVVLAAGNPTPPEDRDEFDAPPFVIDRANLMHPITIYPGRIRRWAQESRLDNLNANFEEWLRQYSWDDRLYPPWSLELPRSAPAYLSHIVNCARLEQYTGRLYPLCRDAQLSLYTYLNDFHLISLASSMMPPPPIRHSIGLFQIQDENKRQAREIMRSLVRTHGALWDAIWNLWSPIRTHAEAAGDDLMSYHAAWQCIPLCELGILQRLDHACSRRYVNHSLRLCYLLLDRVCHWLHMTNSLMNQVSQVTGHTPYEQ